MTKNELFSKNSASKLFYYKKKSVLRLRYSVMNPRYPETLDVSFFMAKIAYFLGEQCLFLLFRNFIFSHFIIKEFSKCRISCKNCKPYKVFFSYFDFSYIIDFCGCEIKSTFNHIKFTFCVALFTVETNRICESSLHFPLIIP